ncbi:MAG TPA: hypothetical protein VFE42_22050 [Chloroflexota bacterium]|nr:hypothetical protein [Chloroflexota bacterium]
MDEASAIWRLWLARRRWEQAHGSAEASGDQAAIREATRALAALPAVDVLDALRANAHLVSVLTAQRRIAMKVAREQGASLEQIGQALGVSRQSAWEFLRRKIATHQRSGLQSMAMQDDSEGYEAHVATAAHPGRSTET